MADSVLECMVRCLQEHTGNPAAGPAGPARTLIAAASETIATLIDADPASVVYTSGATEADNAAVFGGVRLKPQGSEIVSARTEHAAVLEALAKLRDEGGYTLRWCPLNAHGQVEPEALRAVLSEKTALVSLMLVNNETGVIQDIPALAAVCRERGIPMHVDAAQAAGRVPIRFNAWGIDALSLSAHKQHGPVGIGALVLKEPWLWRPWVLGGGQQRGLRSGTLPVAQIVGMGEAYRLAALDEQSAHFSALTERLWAGIAHLPQVRLNAAAAPRAGHILSVSFDEVDGDALHALLAQQLWVSRGSACHSESGEPSKVLRGLGLSDALMQATVRFSVGRTTTTADIDVAIDVVTRAHAHLWRLAGL